MHEHENETSEKIVKFMAKERLIEEWALDVEQNWKDSFEKILPVEHMRGALLLVAAARQSHHDSVRAQALNALYGNVNAVMLGKTQTELINLAQPSHEDYTKLVKLGFVSVNSTVKSRSRC